MNTERSKRRTQSRARSGRGIFTSLFVLASLLVVCFLFGFFVLGPRIQKSNTAKDLSVSTEQVPSSPSGVSGDSEPAVEVIQRRVIKPEEDEQAGSKPGQTSSGMKLEIEHPVSNKPVRQESSEEQAEVSSSDDGSARQLFRVEVRGFSDEDSAGKAADDLSEKGYAPVVNRVITEAGTEYRVQVGAFKSKDNASRVADDVRVGGLNASVAGPEE